MEGRGLIAGMTPERAEEVQRVHDVTLTPDTKVPRPRRPSVPASFPLRFVVKGTS